VNKSSLDATPSNLRVFIVCLLTFAFLTTPMAAMAGTRGTGGSREPVNKRTAGETTKAAAKDVFANPAPVFAASPIISASMTDSIENDDGDNKIDPTNGVPATTERIAYSTTITNSGTVDATGVQFTDTIDSHTTLINGTLNVSPLAGDDSYDTIANTLLEVGPVGSPANAAKVTVTGSVFSNDTEFLSDTFTLSKLQATVYPGSGTVTAASTNGSVTMDGSGHFSYTPTAGFVGDDTFTYTIADSGGLTGVATVTIHVKAADSTIANSKVWYVKNNVAGTGTGTSTDPFKLLSGAQTAANGSGDIVYVYTGDSTTTNQNSGFTFQNNNQKLIGEGIALSVNQTVNGVAAPNQLRGAGTAPHIGNSAGVGVALSNRTNIFIQGLNIAATADGINATFTTNAAGNGVTIDTNTISSAANGGNGIFVGTTTTTSGLCAATITNNTVSTSGTTALKGISVVGAGSGGVTLNVSSNSVSSKGNGIDIDGSGVGAGILTITGFASNAINGNSGATGINVNTATFDQTPLGSFQTVSGGTTVIGASGNGVGGSGLVLNTIKGDLNFTDLDIFADGAVGLQVVGTGQFTGSAGTKFTVGSSVGSVTTTAGSGVNIQNATIDVQGLAVSSTGGTNGVSLTGGVFGTFSSLSGSSAIASASGDDFVVGTGTADITWNGPITSSTGHTVNVSGHSGGTVSFTGLITDTGTGISLTNNTGATISFSGGLSLSTGLNDAFTATGGGSVTATQDNSSIINTITTTSGKALNVQNTTIGASNLTFRSISAGTASGSAGNGIILNTTGASGSLKVVGTGAAGSGGTIQHKTGSDAPGVGNVPAGTQGIGILLISTTTPFFDRMQLNDFDNFAIYGSNVAGFTLNNSTVNGANGNNSSLDEGSIIFDGLTGTSSIASDTITGSVEDNFRVRNTSGTANDIVINNCNITGSSTANANDNIAIEPSSSAVITAHITNNTFTSARGDHIGTSTTNTATLNIVISGNLMSNPLAGLGGGITISGGNAGSAEHVNFNVHDNGTSGSPIVGTQNGGAININEGQGGGTWQGQVANNFIGNAAVSGSGCAACGGIRVENHSTSGTMTAIITNNVIKQWANGPAINTQAGDAGNASNTGILNLTVTNNVASNPVAATAQHGFVANIGAGSGSNTAANVACVDASGNTLDGNAATGGAGLRVRQREVSTVRVRGYTGTAYDSTAVATYVQSQNPSSTPAATASTSSLGPGFLNTTPAGSQCTQPTLVTENFSNKRNEFFALAIDESIFAPSNKSASGSTVAGVLGTIDGYASILRSAETTSPRANETAADLAIGATVATGGTGANQAAPTLLSRTINSLGNIVRSVDSLVEPTSYAAEKAAGSAPRAAGRSDVKLNHARGTKAARNSEASAPAAAPFSGETVTFDNGGSGFTLPVGKSVTITFKVTLNNLPNLINSPYPTGGPQVSNQGRVFGTNFTLVNGVSIASVNTDDPAPPAPLANGTHDPTVTYADLFNTTTGVVTSGSPSFQGDTVTFTATVSFNPTGSPSGTPGTPTGTVQFLDGASPITCNEGSTSTQTLNGSGVATCTTSTLTAASHTINVNYNGDGNFDTSSGNVSQTVNPCTANPIVTNTNDSGAGSLRDAIANACTGNTIDFNIPGAGPFTITLTTGQLSLTRNVTITNTSGKTIQVSGNNASRVFNVSQNLSSVNISNITIMNGNVTGSGGGIANNQGSTLTLTNVALTNNTASNGGGGVANLCSGSPGPVLIIKNSTISGNTASGVLGGGGVYHDCGLSSSKIYIDNTTIDSNHATNGGGQGGGAISLQPGAPIYVSNSAISNNDATASGGAIYAASSNASDVQLINTTISGNSTNGNGGGINGRATLTNVTVTNNRADADNNATGTGGGISIASSSTVLLNTIVAGNFAGSGATRDDINGAGTISGSFNLIGDGTGMNGISNGTNNNQVGSSGSPIDAMLGVLANNGGVTQTHKLLATSTAIEAGTDVTTLNGGIDNVTTSVTLTDASAIPGNVNFTIQIDSEQMTVSSKAGNVLTVARHANGTIAASHLNGAGVNPAFDQRGSGFLRKADSADADTTQTVDIGAYEAHPTVEDITDKSTAENTPFNFNFNIGDGTTTPTLITSVTATSNNAALVTNAHLSVTGSGATRNLAITPETDANTPANSTATITVTVTATNGQTATDTFVLTVTEVNNPPTANPDTITDIAEDCASGCSGGKYVIPFTTLTGNDSAGPANESSQTLTIVLANNPTGGTVAINGTNVEFTPTADFNGAAGFDYTVQDNGTTNGVNDFKTASAHVSFNITAVNDPVSAAAPSTVSLPEDSTNFAVTGMSISDVDAVLAPSGVYEATLSSTNGTMTMTTLTGLTFTVGDGTADPTMTFHGTLANINNALATAKYTPTANYNGSAQITLGVTDIFAGIVATGSGSSTSDSKTVNVTVTAVADTPSVTNSTTSVNLQTTTGLVISRNAVDSTETAFFKITSIQNGTLFQHDGTTPINNNDFITFAQGNAGLRFTPANNSTLSGSFVVQASNDNIGTGLSSGTATATITVSKSDTTTNVTSNHNPAYVNQSVTYTATITSNTGYAGPPTGNVDFKDNGSAISGCTGKVLDGSGVATCTTSYNATGSHPISATYNGDSAFNGGSGNLTGNPEVVNPTLALVVNTTDDTPDQTLDGNCADINGKCSLRAAIQETNNAPSDDTITFNIPTSEPGYNAGTSTYTITLTSALPDITGNLTITGPNAVVNTNPIVVSGNNLYRILNVSTAGVNLTLNTLGFTAGKVPGGGNAAAIEFDAAGTLTMDECEVFSNTDPGSAALYANGSNGVVINRSTFRGNVDGMVVEAVPTFTVNNSTISNNTLRGIYNLTTSLSVTNSTIADNSGGINNDAFSHAVAASLGNTLMSNNGGQNLRKVGANSNTFTSNGHNLIDDNSGSLLVAPGAGDLLGPAVVAGIAPLANNGGPTQTRALNSNSAAFDAGDNTLATNAGLTTDQRGTGFNRIVDGPDADSTATVDIGAFESQGAIEDITDKSTSEDTPLVFTFNVSNGVSSANVTGSSSNTTIVPNASVVATGASSPLTLTVTPAPNQNTAASGPITITVTVTVGGQSMSDTFQLTVLSVPDPPSVTNASTNEDVQTTSGLVITKNVVDGPDVAWFKITNIQNGTLFKTDGATPIGNGGVITEAEGNAGLKFTPAPNFFGAGSFDVQASNASDGSNASVPPVTATITVSAVADTPSITATTTNEDTQSTTGLVISRNAADGAEVTHFKITGITGGTLFQNNGTTQIANGDFITFAQGNAGLKFTPGADKYTPHDTFGFTIQASTSNTDAGLGGNTVNASITVTPIADTPSVTNSSTQEDVQTTTGLVISRNAVDGNEVTNFKITNITGGTLFKNDGTTQIANNSFITVAEGNAGLKFTPSANSFANGTFQVYAGTDNAGGGLSANFATATITVSPVGDPPSITSAITNEDTQSTTGLVITRNAVDGAEITFFKITNITNGTLYQNNGTTVIGNGSFITVAQGNAGLKFTPAANLYSPGSTFTFSAAAGTDNVGGGLGTATAVSITVNAVADSPLVTPNPQNTAISTQTGPMTINRNAADGAEVTNFKITNITNGTLYQNDGTTVINANDFITVAQGNAGLKFTPTAGLGSPANNFGFDVQASLNNTNGGLGPDPAVHENILVNCSDPQSVTKTVDDGSAGTLRYAIINSCPGTGSVTFNLPAGPQTIMLSSSLTIAKTLAITGPTNQAITINGSGGFSVLSITAGSPTISNLTITGGTNSDGAGLFNNSSGTVTLNGMTFTGNSASGGLGGGGIFNNAGTLVIKNSTISGNTGSPEGGGLLVNGGSIVTLLNDTITNNTAGGGSGVQVTSGTLNVKNTIIAGNNSSANVQGVINDQGNNILSGNPQLAPLANNGGPTMTHALLANSPALDAGDNTAAAALVGDQRGIAFGRFRDAANDADTTQTVDIGSFEADPSIEDIQDKTTNEDTPLPTFSFRVADTSSAFDSITATSNNQALVQDGNILITGGGNSRNMDITPVPNQFGTATITVTVKKTVNSTQLSMSDTFVLTVNAVGDPPNVTNAATNEDTQTTSGLVITKNAVDGAEINNFKITNITNGTLFQNNGTTQINNGDFITVAQGNAGLKFTPAPNSFAPGSFQVQSSLDNIGNGLSQPTTATITVTAIADTPSVTNASTFEDVKTTSGLVISRNAVDGAEVTHFKITNIQNGTLFQNDGTTTISNGSFITFAQGNAGLKFLPAANLNNPGTTFSFQVQAATDAFGGGLSAGIATATITVTAVNDAPSFTKGANQAILEDAGAQTVAGWATAISAGPADESGQALNFIVTNNNNALFSAQPGIDGTGKLTYTPAANANGLATVSVSLHDNGGTANGGVDTSAIQTFTITVTAVNDVPTFTPGGNQTVNEDAGAQSVAWATAISAGPPDESGQVLNFIVTNNNNSLFSVQPAISPNGTLTYTSAPDANGTATVSVKLHDDGGTANGGVDTSAQVQFTITVNAVNDAPVNLVPGLQTVSQNNPLTFSIANNNSISVTDVDAGNGQMQETLTATHGTITLGGTAGLAFTVGNGTANTTMTFTGTLASINAALQGMVFNPTTGYNGPATLVITSNDQGNTGSGGPLSDTDTINITVQQILSVGGGGNLQFSATTYSVSENNGPAVITINRSGGSLGTTTVDIATSNGTATAGSDYTAVSQTVTFNDGEVVKTVNIPITDDLFNEPDETVNLTLSNVTGTGSLGAPSTAVLTIVDNDPAGGYIKFNAPSYSVNEGGVATITVQRVGTLTQPVTVDYATSDSSDPALMVLCKPTPGNTIASSRCDFTSAFGRLSWAAGDGADKTFKVMTTQDYYVEGPETLTLTLSNLTGNAGFSGPSTETLTINDDAVEPPGNAIDDSGNFVEQLYRDFLNRPSDPAGKAFWVNNIDHCNDPAQRPAGQSQAQCIQISRIVTAGAFFLSIEFQATGGTAYLTNKVSFGSKPTFVRFETDAQEIGQNYVFGQPGAEALLEANKVAYYNDYVSRTEFLNTYAGVSNAQYVDTLISNTAVSFTLAERNQLVNGLNNQTETRATVLRKISEKPEFRSAEFNTMFVLMEYFGYLRRNPDTPGFNFWLNKLNSFGGDYFAAEMVKAFIESAEYRQRFGQ
jgi:CSLREA domain-containing protein